MLKTYWVKMYNAVPIQLTEEEAGVLSEMLQNLDNLQALNLLADETTLLKDNPQLERALQFPKLLVEVTNELG